MGDRQEIDVHQFAVITAASYLGLGLFQFPRELVEYGHADAGWSFLLLVGAALGFLWLDLQVAQLSGDGSIVRALNTLLTPWGAYPLQVVRWLVHLFLALSALANFGLVMRTFFLPGTPVWAIEMAMLATAGYLAWYGLNVMGRTLEAGFLPTLIASVGIGVLVVPQIKFSWAILPVLHFAVRPILSGTYHSAYIFMGVEVVAQVYPHVRPAQRALATRYAFGMVLATAAFFAFGYSVVMGTEGPYMLVQIQWPPVSALRLANIQGFFINKLGLLVVVLWGLFVLGFLGIRLWCLSDNLTALVPGDHRTFWYRWAVGGAAIATLITAQLFGNIVTLTWLFLNWGLPVVTVYLITFPLIVLGVNGLRTLGIKRRGVSTG